jgi:hypothetical protein
MKRKKKVFKKDKRTKSSSSNQRIGFAGKEIWLMAHELHLPLSFLIPSNQRKGLSRVGSRWFGGQRNRDWDAAERWKKEGFGGKRKERLVVNRGKRNLDPELG